jgi:4-hydroxybenzoate polyprenyltransferase
MKKGFSFRAYIDLTRAHFFFVWPILFCSGLALAFQDYGGFSWELAITAALIGLFGFEAGLVLNDYVDRDLDKKDTETDRLTKYWRPFGNRPIASGQITAQGALQLFYLLVFITIILILRLPYPNSLYVFLIMLYSYSVEYFYQIKKRDQKFPLAQILGRTDFALFPVAGYLCFGRPDMTALSYFLFFYPLALAHLGVNDLADCKNDIARGLKTVSVLYGQKGTAYWTMFFTGLHFLCAPLLMAYLGPLALTGFSLSFLLLLSANYFLIRNPDPMTALKVLPIVHAVMLIYAVSIITGLLFAQG